MPHASLRDFLPEEHAVVLRPGIGATARIIQRCSLRRMRVSIDHPMLILVLRGDKEVGLADALVRIPQGDVVILAGGRAYDMRNLPDPQGVYEAAWIDLDPALAADLPPPLASAIPQVQAITPTAGCQEAFERTAAAIKDAALPQSVVRLRTLEMLAWIAESGAAPVWPPGHSLVTRLRRLVAAQPDQRWMSAAVAERLGMSEATLRRRLAAEGRSFNEVLADVRMSRALALLQSSNLSILEIALAVGYDSPSRFAARFLRRFGHRPADIRRTTRASA